jgi:hypothetical protein
MPDIEIIYNTYLRVSRTNNGQPFKYRKDFSKISEDEKYPILLKLENFFNRNNYVNINDFFNAPYHVYEDEKRFDLNFFITPKAIKAYNIFQKRKKTMDPDSEIQRKMVLEGSKFIYKFCKNNSIGISDYLNHKTNNLNTVFIHLKEKNISIYNCFAFDNFQKVVNSQNYEFLEFMLGDLISKLSIYRTKFLCSKKCKHISISSTRILKEELDKNIRSGNMEAEL